MKKILLALALASVVLLPAAASAINFEPPSGDSIGTVPDLINRILTPVWQVFIGFAVIMILVAGILFLAANGNADKVGTARMALLWGVVGVVVGVLAFSITTIVRVAVSGT